MFFASYFHSVFSIFMGVAIPLCKQVVKLPKEKTPTHDTKAFLFMMVNLRLKMKNNFYHLYFAPSEKLLIKYFERSIVIWLKHPQAMPKLLSTGFIVGLLHHLRHSVLRSFKAHPTQTCLTSACIIFNPLEA